MRKKEDKFSGKMDVEGEACVEVQRPSPRSPGECDRIDGIDAPAVPSWGRVGVLPVERRAQTKMINGRTGKSSEPEISCGGASSLA